MTQRRRVQASEKVGLTAAVSDLAFTSSERPGIWNPHFIGNTLLLPFLSGAMTGTTSVGLTTPEESSGFPASTNLRVSFDASAASIRSLISRVSARRK
jgi:hypothetical protein